jgi:hypothetical protein
LQEEETPALVQEEVQQPTPLVYENIDELCKTQGMIFVCSWEKKEETTAAVWQEQLEKIFDAAKAEPHPHFKDALSLVKTTDTSIVNGGQLTLSSEALEQDETIKRTNKEDIDFAAISENNAQIQFYIRINANEYTPEAWKQVIGRVIEFSDRQKADAEDAELSTVNLLESLDDVERLPVKLSEEIEMVEDDAVLETEADLVVVKSEDIDSAD